uniref:Putative conserved secreted protein n=1 Tax=Nyssomyia neivai TaxID=330878 RepID=A0A1L8DP23_9DIPT
MVFKVQLFSTIFCGCLLLGSTLPVIDLTGHSIPISETLVENEALAIGDDPLPESEQSLVKLVSEQNVTSNGTVKDLYVIRAVVYEIGILTDVPENETYTGDEDEVINERVDLTFFNAHKNDTHLDLGSIPLPVQTNISGQVLTGIAPINIGAIDVEHPEEILETLPITGTIVNITKSESSMFVINTSNVTFDQLNTYLDEDDLTKIPVVSNAIPAVEKLETNIPLSEALSDLL